MAEEVDWRKNDEQRQRKVDKRVNRRENQGHDPGPVSYTHLDVYKRQR